MKLWSGLLGVTLLLLALGPATAQEQQPVSEAVPDAVATPDPQQLDSDWWRFISEAGDSLEQRLASLVARVEAVPSGTPAERRGSLHELTETVRSGAATYKTLRQTPTTDSIPAPIAQASYSLEALLALHQSQQKMQSELEFDRQEVDRIETVLKLAKRQLDTARAAYLQKPVSDSDRYIDGLRIIADRLNLELAKEDLRLKHGRLKSLRDHLEVLMPVVEAAELRLSIEPEELEQLREQAQLGPAQVERLRAELTRLQLSNTYGAAETAEERIRSRHYEIRVATTAARLSAVELANFVYQMGRMLGEVSSGESSLSPEATRALLEASAVGIAAARESRLEWVQIVRRGQTDLEGQLNNPLALRNWIALQGQLQEATANVDGRLRDAELLRQLLARRLAKQEGWLATSLQSGREAFADSLDWVGGFMTMSLFEVSETPVTPLGLTRVVVILGIAWLLSRGVRRALDRLRSRKDSMNQAALYTLGRVLHYLLLLVGLLIALSSIGIDFTKFALFASALGVGIGFGLQNLISNFVAGLILLFERSLKVGDFVELESGVTGEVQEISIRSTLITTNDNVDIVVPNSEFVSTRVTNWTMRQAHRRVRIPFGVAYGTDKELVRQAVLEAAQEVPHTLSQKNREPQVWLVNFGESSLDFELVVWLRPEAVKRPSRVAADYNWAIESALGRYDIEIPFPQRDLHMRSPNHLEPKPTVAP